MNFLIIFHLILDNQLGDSFLGMTNYTSLSSCQFLTAIHLGMGPCEIVPIFLIMSIAIATFQILLKQSQCWYLMHVTSMSYLVKTTCFSCRIWVFFLASHSGLPLFRMSVLWTLRGPLLSSACPATKEVHANMNKTHMK